MIHPTTMTERTLLAPEGRFIARPPIPGDKSLSHRALIFAAMAEGTSRVVGLGPGADIAATDSALRSLGVIRDGATVTSLGVAGWSVAPGPLDVGNSGTTMRLLAGVLAGRPFRSTLVGDDSLTARPMGRLVAPLEALGATVETSAAGTSPLSVHAPAPLVGADCEIGLASAQVRSAFQLAALQASGPSQVDSPPGFRDHTERWLAALGLGEWRDDTAFAVHPGPIPPGTFSVPGDPSSAAFLWAAAALRPGAVVETHGVSLNPGRIGFLDVLSQFGAEVEHEPVGAVHGDPVGRVMVRGGTVGEAKVGGTLTVRSLDELPLVAVLAGAGDGVTKVADAGELRTKESDRIASTVAMLRAIGGVIEPTDDGFVVEGSGGYRAGRVQAGGDHRIAMAAAVAATAADGPISVAGAGIAAVSWPGFYDALEAAWSSR